jgi:hypothetical protein
MPYKGECLRGEGHFTTKEKVKMKDMIVTIAAANGNGGERKHPFITVEEMLMKKSGKDIEAPSIKSG